MKFFAQALDLEPIKKLFDITSREYAHAMYYDLREAGESLIAEVERLRAVRDAAPASPFGQIETWLLEQELIISDAPRHQKPTHGLCCTCQTCGFEYDRCCCDENERTRQWRELRAALEAERTGQKP